MNLECFVCRQWDWIIREAAVADCVVDNEPCMNKFSLIWLSIVRLLQNKDIIVQGETNIRLYQSWWSKIGYAPVTANQRHIVSPIASGDKVRSAACKTKQVLFDKTLIEQIAEKFQFCYLPSSSSNLNPESIPPET